MEPATHHHHPYLGLDAAKPVFGVFNKARPKPVCSATENSWKIEILLVEKSDMILSIKGIVKALISLRGCAGWSAPLLFANPKDRISRVETDLPVNRNNSNDLITTEWPH